MQASKLTDPLGPDVLDPYAQRRSLTYVDETPGIENIWFFILRYECTRDILVKHTHPAGVQRG